MTTGDEIYRALQRQARQAGRDTSEIMTLYVLEGFLSRVAHSRFNEQLILKGGVLLAAWSARRPTRDIDFAALDMSNENATILDICREIATLAQDDGITFIISTASAVTIRDDDEYSGVRVSMQARIATAQITFHVDINVGDPVIPGAVQVNYPRILDSSIQIQLLGYPITMVFAEKIVTALQRGIANTRWRDFGDIYNLSRIHSIPSKELRISIEAVSAHRIVEIAALQEVLVDYPSIGQTKYENWRVKRDRIELPEDFGTLLNSIYEFTDPILGENVSQSSVWNPFKAIWN